MKCECQRDQCEYKMDQCEYQQYCSIIESGELSLDALKRIIKHDAISGWENTSGGLSRIQVLKDCLDCKINYKLNDEESDVLYGVNWPMPWLFKN